MCEPVTSFFFSSSVDSPLIKVLWYGTRTAYTNVLSETDFGATRAEVGRDRPPSSSLAGPLKDTLVGRAIRLERKPLKPALQVADGPAVRPYLL